MIRRALDALSIRDLLLSIHELSLPGDPDDDAGHGSPLSRGGRAFLLFASRLGFDGLLLGPHGETTPYDPSPYDATLFSRGTASLSLDRLAREGLIPPSFMPEAIAARPPAALQRVAHPFAHATVAAALDVAWQRARDDGGLRRRLDEFGAQNQHWLERAELYGVLAALHGDADWRRWPARDRLLFARGAGEAEDRRRRELASTAHEAVARYRFGQLLAHEQHGAFHQEARGLGLRLFADLQIGISHRDLWSRRGLLLDGFRMGAPPSRTNPEGQAWGYGVLDPDLHGAARAFVRERADRLLDEYDGFRVDHPHGLIDPWVYSDDVQRGARLFSSPERPDLRRFAIARDDQIDSGESAHGDGRVRDLTEAQVDRYAVLFDALVSAAAARGLPAQALIVEVLSTQPYPVRRVLERRGLGRFRVTQKASMTDASDVYRSEHARPQDWTMVGTHDTEPIWLVAERWVASGAAHARAAWLASRLVPQERERGKWIARTAASPEALARAQLADLFVGPAEHVLVFFSDLFGLREVYNRPGTISPENWTLRVPPDFESAYARAVDEGCALDLCAALAAAIRARGDAFAAAHGALLDDLQRESPRSSAMSS